MAADYIDTTDKNEDRSDRLTLSHDLFISHLAQCSQEDQDRMNWLWGYLHNVLNRSRTRLIAELGQEWEDVRHYLSGDLAEPKHADMVEAIESLMRRAARQKPLVSTIVTERIIEALDYCRDYSAMIYVSGPTGRGKTCAAEYWTAQNNHGRTRYVRIPSDCSRRTLVFTLCRACGVSARGNTADMEANLHKALTPRNVLILDEAGHLLSRSGRPGGAIELVRDLHDICGCGVALIFTDVYLREVKRGANADYFEQFLGRLEFPVEIEKQPRRDEVRAVLCAFIENPDESLVSLALDAARARDGKLRTLFKDLTRASEFARGKGRALTRADFQLAIKWRKSTGAWPEDR